MAQGLLHLHNFLRWLVLLAGIYCIIRSAAGAIGSKKFFEKGDRKAALFFMIFCDVQLLVGLALYFMNGWFDMLSSGAGVMKNNVLRFFAVEHSVGMIIAIILVHIAYSAAKKNLEDKAKFKKVFTYSLIALIVILASIPWPFREAIGRSLFPGM